MFEKLRRLSAAGQQDGRKSRIYRRDGQDALTGVADRDAFQKLVEQALTGGQGCLVLVDVDRMQEINERLGTETGDRILRNVADVLRENFRENDRIGRLEEDTFGVWVEGLSAVRVGGIRRRVAVVNDKLLQGGGGLPAVTLSAGVAWGERGENYQSLYSQAQKVLHHVKESGRCGCEIYVDR